MAARLPFIRLSVAWLVIILIVMGGVGSSALAGPQAQATTSATMAASGAAGACPPAVMAGSMAGIAATKAATAAAGGSATRAATAAASAGAAMGGENVMVGEGCLLSTALRGAAEAPNPGDPDGMGAAAVRIDAAKGEICYEIAVAQITLPAAAAHIHKGAPGTAGPVVVPFTAPDANGMAMGCVQNVNATLIADILKDPMGYYVNVHTSDFPNGAVRGHLSGAVMLTGKEEAPGPGDPDGSGHAAVTIDAAANQVCYALHVANIKLPATGAHIHKAAAGAAGPVVVPFQNPDANGLAAGCVTADAALVKDILANPASYYVNVHSSEFPNGAIRAQLR
ncbi:MAG: CHRD domain-containing protein [Anaerolineae bacterium]|nr:CHRD domain-containing protein [Anaerolineae bacterium]